MRAFPINGHLSVIRWLQDDSLPAFSSVEVTVYGKSQPIDGHLSGAITCAAECVSAKGDRLWDPSNDQKPAFGEKSVFLRAFFP